MVQCAEGERSYHIFYQLCAGASPALRGMILKSESHKELITVLFRKYFVPFNVNYLLPVNMFIMY